MPVDVLAREEPRRAGEQQHVVVGERVDVRPAFSIEVAVVDDSRLPSPFFSPRNATPGSRAARSTSSSRLWIALWLVRRDADALAGRDQADDRAARRCTSCPSRAAPGRRGSCRRARATSSFAASRSSCSSARRRATARGRRIDFERAGSARRRRAPSARAAAARPAARCVSYGPPGMSARGSGIVLERSARARSRERPGAPRRARRSCPAPSPVAGSKTLSPAPSWCCCAREARTVRRATLARPRAAPVGLEPADRLASRVVRAPRASRSEPVEERPPDRLRLAPVVVRAAAPSSQRWPLGVGDVEQDRRAARAQRSARPAPRSRRAHARAARAGSASSAPRRSARRSQQPVAQLRASRRQSSSL